MMTREEFAASMARVDAIRRKRGAGDGRTTTYGKKGGDGPNQGRQATMYRALAPDGSEVTKRSYKVHEERAYIGFFQHEGKWLASGVFREPLVDNPQTFVVAERIMK